MYLGLHAILAVLNLPFVLSGSNIGHCLNWMTYYDVFQISFSSHLSLKKFLLLFESCNKQWWGEQERNALCSTLPYSLFPTNESFFGQTFKPEGTPCSDRIIVPKTLHPGSDIVRNLHKSWASESLRTDFFCNCFHIIHRFLLNWTISVPIRSQFIVVSDLWFRMRKNIMADSNESIKSFINHSARLRNYYQYATRKKYDIRSM